MHKVHFFKLVDCSRGWKIFINYRYFIKLHFGWKFSVLWGWFYCITHFKFALIFYHLSALQNDQKSSNTCKSTDATYLCHFEAKGVGNIAKIQFVGGPNLSTLKYINHFQFNIKSSITLTWFRRRAQTMFSENFKFIDREAIVKIWETILYRIIITEM